METMPQTYTSQENQQMADCIARVNQLPADSGTALKLADWRVTGEMFMVKGSRLAWVQGKAVMDADLWHCAAYQVQVLSRHSKKIFKDSSGGAGEEELNVTELNGHSFIYQMVIDHKIPGFVPREYVWLCVWRKESEEVVVITFVPHESEGVVRATSSLGKIRAAASSLTAKRVRGSSTLVVRLEKLPPLECGVPQTRVTYTNQTDVGTQSRRVAAKLVNKFAAAQLGPLCDMHGRLDQSEKIDGDKRLEFEEMVRAHNQPYTEDELEVIKEGQDMYEMFEGEKGKVLKLPSSLATAKVARREGDNHAYGWATTTVRASPVQVVAFIWDIVMSRNGMREDTLENAVDVKPTDHNMVWYIKKRSPHPLDNRDFVSRCIWKAQGTGFLFVVAPASVVTRPPIKDAVRAELRNAMKIIKINDSETRLEYVCRPNAGGSVPAFIANRYMTRFVSFPTEIQEYFQNLRPLSIWDAKDGRAVGEALLIKTEEESKKVRAADVSREEARMRVRFTQIRGLREAGERYEWLEGMLARVVKNNLMGGGGGSAAAKVADLTAADGPSLGAGLATCLASNTESDAGVAEWIDKHSALKEFQEMHAWFRPMMDTVGKRLLSKSKFGANFRLGFGASLSSFDQVSDVNTVRLYLTTPNLVGYGYTLLAMLIVNMLAQLLLVWLQTTKGPKATTVKDMLYVVSAVKPGVDAWRVATGLGQNEYQVMSPKSELLVSKGVELAFEAIPGCVVQVQAYLIAMGTEEGASQQALVSLVISALCTGFTAGTITFDNDANVDWRRDDPEHVGLIAPGTRGTLTFGCMILNGALLLIVRSTSTALLLEVGGRYAASYYLADWSIFFAQKWLRNDAGFFQKVSDSSLVQFLLGTLVDWVVKVLALVSSLASVSVYYELTPEDAVLLPEAVAWKAVGGLCAAWITVFAAFLLLIQRRFIKNFFSFETSRELVCANFTKEGASDVAKLEIHIFDPKKWASIRDNVRVWHHANWDRLEEEAADWFTPELVARIDDEFIPVAALVRLNRAAGGHRRRSSTGGSLREAAASARERSSGRDRGGARVAPAAGAD
ncbi:hypothetical protein TeGR_g9733 [Tetraparma gracilis]|uniref:Uncharacterized protein n=1 Tax=Tetraparma gracilis TaxID=2962635 RepID=A0ABQ6MMR6_9STRA|nr:hypothetical protein TeGR_g9733 [Tetraparma gracilis]